MHFIYYMFIYLEVWRSFVEVHPNMRPHPSERVSFILANGTSVGFHACVRIHVSLSGAGGWTDDVTAGTFPARQSGVRDALVSRFGNASTFSAFSQIHFPSL